MKREFVSFFHRSTFTVITRARACWRVCPDIHTGLGQDPGTSPTGLVGSAGSVAVVMAMIGVSENQPNNYIVPYLAHKGNDFCPVSRC